MKQLFDLTGKTAVITGGASGIGRSISLLFADRGAKVAIIDVNQEAGDSLLDAIKNEGGEASYYNCNIVEQEKVSEVFEKIYSNSGSVDILVNNAGIAFVGSIEQTTEEDLDRLYEVNIKGTYNCTLAAIKKMKSDGGGSILNLTSAAALVGLADRFGYSMTKGAMLTMTYSVAKDYVDQGIRCNSIAPGRVHTPFVDGYLAKNYPGREKEMFDVLSKSQPIGRMGEPEEMAYLALYLCSDESSFVTGSNYCIDGGFVTLNT